MILRQLRKYFSFRRQIAVQKLMDWHRDELWLKQFRAKGGWRQFSMSAVLLVAMLFTGQVHAQIAQDAVTGSSGGGGSPGGSSGQIQYNNGGSFGGFTMAGDCTFSQPNINCNLTNFGIVSNRWYASFPFGRLNFGGTPVANSIACKPAVFPLLVTIKALGFYNNVVGSSNVQMAIYANDIATGRPAALIGNTNSVSNTTTGTHSGALLVNKQLGPGGSDGGRQAWLCSNVNDTTAGYGIPATDSGMLVGAAIGSSSLNDILIPNNQIAGITCSGTNNCGGVTPTFGTWPSTLAGSTWVDETPSTTGIYSPIIGYQAN